MNHPIQVHDGLAALLDTIASAGGLVTPEQEQELAGYDLKAVLDAILSHDYRADRLKALEVLVRSHRKAAELTSEMLRSAAVDAFKQAGATKAKDPDENWTASLTASPGRIVLQGDIEEVPALYVQEKVEVSVNNALAKVHLEAGQEIKSTKTGLPILTLERSQHVRITKSQKAKLAEVGSDVGTLLGMSATPPAVSGPALKLMKGPTFKNQGERRDIAILGGDIGE